MMRIVELDGERREERGERRDTQICLIDTIKRGKEVSVTQWRMMKLWASAHVSPLSSPVSRVKTGQSDTWLQWPILRLVEVVA